MTKLITPRRRAGRLTGQGRLGQGVRKTRTAARALRLCEWNAPGSRDKLSVYAPAMWRDGAPLSRSAGMMHGVANATKLVARRRRCGLRYGARRETARSFGCQHVGCVGCPVGEKLSQAGLRRIGACDIVAGEVRAGIGCAGGNHRRENPAESPAILDRTRLPRWPTSGRRPDLARACRAGKPRTCPGRGQRRAWRDRPGRRSIRRTVHAGCMRRACAGSRIETSALRRADCRAPCAAQFGMRNAGCGSQKFKFCLGWEHSHATKEGT